MSASWRPLVTFDTSTLLALKGCQTSVWRCLKKKLHNALFSKKSNQTVFVFLGDFTSFANKKTCTCTCSLQVDVAAITITERCALENRQNLMLRSDRRSSAAGLLFKLRCAVNLLLTDTLDCHEYYIKHKRHRIEFPPLFMHVSIRLFECHALIVAYRRSEREVWNWNF